MPRANPTAPPARDPHQYRAVPLVLASSAEWLLGCRLLRVACQGRLWVIGLWPSWFLMELAGLGYLGYGGGSEPRQTGTVSGRKPRARNRNFGLSTRHTVAFSSELMKRLINLKVV